MDNARSAGVPVSLDLNYRQALWTPEEAGECLRDLVTRADGVVAHCAGRRYVQAAHRVPVVDPVGAGDAFAAGYLAEFVRDRPVEVRLATASAAGAYAVTVEGDWEGLPSRDDLELLRSAEDAVHR